MYKARILFYILIRSWKSFKYFDRCVNSVFMQNYNNYQILFIDDASGYSANQKKHIKEKLKNHIVVFNKRRRYSLFNGYYLISKYASNNNAVILNLDGDDWLLRKDTLLILSKVYEDGSNCSFTYGECLVWDGSLSKRPSRYILPNVNRTYSKKIIKDKSYRKEPFLPFHLYSWKVWLFKRIPKKFFLDSDGNWLRFAQDQAIIYPMLEMAIKNLRVIKKPLYVYNIANKHGDENENLKELLRDELVIRRKTPCKPIIQ